MARGGKREGAGRPAGAVNKATVERRATIAEMAQEYAEEAISTLAQIATMGESESARVAAANAILDRAYGKPSQAMELGGKGGGAITFERIERVIIDPKHRNTEGVRPALTAEAL